MEYQEIINLLDNTPNQPSRFRTKNWFVIKDDSCGTQNTNSQIKFKTSVLKSSLCDYSDVYVIVNGTITITGKENDDASWQADKRNKEGAFGNSAPFVGCISKINNIQIDNGKYLDVVMLICNLIE